MQSRQSRGGQVLVAPDKFKGTLTATQAAGHIAAGLRSVRGDLEIAQVPVADGGEGTVAAAVAAGYQPVRLGVRGPTGQPARAEFGWRDGTAIIEAAQACGLARLPGGRLRPLAATSFGVGELIAAAAARGARRIVLGLGGVASTDGGAGMVQALGGRLLDQAGRELPPGGAALAALRRLDLAGLPSLAGIEVLVAADVDNPLLGRHGAAAVYGPQKGASPDDVAILEAGLARWADCSERALAGQVPGTAGQPGPRPSPRVSRPRDEPGAGAAGGLGFAALAFLGARTRPGIELMLDLIGFAGGLPGPGWSSPARDRWTPRRCAARLRPGWRARPQRRARQQPPVPRRAPATRLSCRLSRSPAAARSASPGCTRPASRPSIPSPTSSPTRPAAWPAPGRCWRRRRAGWRRTGCRPASRARRPEPAMSYDLVLRSRRVVLPGGVRRGAVAVRQEKIAAIAGYDARLDAASDHDLGDLALLPGLVDTHVHVNEPGRTEWEGFESATRAAAAGGVTTICDMPLNSLPPTVTARALRVKRAAAAGKCAVNVAFWGGAVPGSQPELRGLHEAGVTGFKCFLADSGVPEFPPLDARGPARGDDRDPPGGLCACGARRGPGRARRGVRDRLPVVPGVPPAAGRAPRDRDRDRGGRTHRRPGAHRAPVRGRMPPDDRPARASGVALTAETCPHYLFFAAEEVPPGGTEFKCCPPIRDAVNREALWRGLEAGVIDCVVSDHSPCPPALKRKESGDFGAAWGGIASLQLALAAVWTAARQRGRTLADVARWMAAAPAALAGLSGKGMIAAGNDADLVAFDPDATFTVRGAGLEHRSPVTPYEGRVLAGAVRQVWLRGQVITADSRPAGRLLRRPGTRLP